MQIYKYASMQVCKYVGIQVCKYANMQVCMYAGMQVLARYLLSESFYLKLAITCKNLFLLLVAVRLVVFKKWV